MTTYKKMNPVYKPIWLKALRSGEYNQTREVLSNSDGYCCLGVLCDVSEKNDLGIVSNASGDGKLFNVTPDHSKYPEEAEDDYEISWQDMWEGGELSEEMRSLFGISKSVHSRLIDMNDGNNGTKPRNFNEIADWIDKNL